MKNGQVLSKGSARKSSVIKEALVGTLLVAGFAANAQAAIPIGSYSATATATAPAAPGSIDPITSGSLVFGGIGGAVSFTSPSAGLLTMTVTDCCLVGDIYQAFVDGSSLGYTSYVPLGGSTLSTGTFTDSISAGVHTFDLTDILLSYIGYSDPFGGGVVTTSYSPAGVNIDLSVSPVSEPRTYAMLLAGLGLIGFMTSRRKSKSSNIQISV